jgi:hypothetical protein
MNREKAGKVIIIKIIIIIIYTANGFLPGGSRTRVRHNAQIHTYTENEGHTMHNEYSANTITKTTNTISTTIK